jgi:hypothetical protein
MGPCRGLIYSPMSLLWGPCLVAEAGLGVFVTPSVFVSIFQEGGRCTH